MKAAQSVLLIVDIQERLLPAIYEGAQVLENILWLTGVARQLEVPVLATEQYPRGLGHSVPDLQTCLNPGEVLEKMHFSALGNGALFEASGGERRQWIVTGTETHVCVLQTVLDLLAAGRQVYVLEEGVGSRRDKDKQLALERMRQEGARIVSREMVAFEWLEQAGTPEFRAVLKDFIR